MKILRVFPRRTAATPDDSLARIACPPSMFDEADEVHISVAFSWDIPLAERLEKMWRHVAPVHIGGPAMNAPGGDFIPGRYVKNGYVLTSRGCPNRCWFCQVWRREGGEVRELPITEGWNVLDDNLLACSDKHIQQVFAMLESQKANGHRIEFTGGLEAARLLPWHVASLRQLRPKQTILSHCGRQERCSSALDLRLPAIASGLMSCADTRKTLSLRLTSAWRKPPTPDSFRWRCCTETRKDGAVQTGGGGQDNTLGRLSLAARRLPGTK